MDFELQGKRYAFNQLFDGWRLALAAQQCFEQQRAVELVLSSGAKLMINSGDVPVIYRQVTKPADTPAPAPAEG
jgi:hypothetical protein